MEQYSYKPNSSSYHERFLRNSRAIGVLWAVFTICYAFINVLVFVQPQWIGSVPGHSQGMGYFGLYDHCIPAQDGNNNCRWSIFNFSDVISTPFKIATIFVGVAAILILVCVACFLLFLCISSKVVYCICAWLQLFSFLCMLAGCVVFPAGWNDARVREICASNRYEIGLCEFRWAYILALIGIFDICFLALLGFMLASWQVKILAPDYTWATRAQDNMAFSGFAGSPTMIMPYYDEANFVRDQDSTRNLQL